MANAAFWAMRAGKPHGDPSWAVKAALASACCNGAVADQSTLSLVGQQGLRRAKTFSAPGKVSQKCPDQAV